MLQSYPDFFREVTGYDVLPYQAEYGRDPFKHTLMIVPTGLGKTDTVLLPWLYAKAAGQASPKRLILVLPRQNLTQQTAENARDRLAKAAMGEKIRVLELMGGSGDNKEKLRPDESAVIVATQDLYFSRALNRGYARRPPHWPIDFALYNQDCLIVLDEIQLMDDALATSTQLAAFRDQYGVFGDAPCVWMSATVKPEWLTTIDRKTLPRLVELSADDRMHPIVQKRLHAAKRLAEAPETCRSSTGCATFALAHHRVGTRTLIIANTVARAREVAAALRAQGQSPVLLHSRFRPVDRTSAVGQLSKEPGEGQIVVATQVLEAGVNLTSRLMITDLAPWGSLVQRFGRVNRYGEDNDAEIMWIDRPTSAKQKDWFAPYSEGECARAEERVRPLKSAAPADLPQEDGPAPWRYVLRRRDLLDLFDTSSDLSGNEIDVSRFIRATEDKDVYLGWRRWDPASGPSDDIPDLDDDELCPVAIGEAREFISKHRGEVFAWNYALEQWVTADKERLYPGMILLVRAEAGGYSPTEGWSPESRREVPPVELPRREGMDSDTADPTSFRGFRQTLTDHTALVVKEIERLLTNVPVTEEFRQDLVTAAEKHDWGKVHEVFQETMHRYEPGDELLAKQVKKARHKVRHFRHELASALAMLQCGDSNLAAYLAASHHGKVRMSIRSMPGERQEGERAIARGINDGDRLRGVEELIASVGLPETQLSLAPMEFGAAGGSWTERTIKLLDQLGPFRMAYLEMLLRAADSVASEANAEVTECTA